MEESWLKGNLSERHFSQVLFRIWQTEKSGFLKIKVNQKEQRLYLERGNIAIEQSTFPEPDFLKALVKKGILEFREYERCEHFALQQEISLTKALLELQIFNPSQLWELMGIFFKEGLFPIFDLTQGEYAFDPDLTLQGSTILFSLHTPNVILEGIRQMNNYELFEVHIPDENWIIQILSPDYLNQIHLGLHERYLLNMKNNKKILRSLYDTSELGKKETQKVIFALFSLGLIRFPQKKTREDLPQEASLFELGKIMDIFNSKSTYIYKYISKEIGPVALNVLDKCLEEIKSHLSPGFQKSGIGPDGRIDLSFLKAKKGIFSKEEKKALINDLNEILAAEVLAVKKTLGNEHEAALIQNLEKASR